ncbi:hypothetical protein PSAC2689_120080 [Paraburkholderia sacchari]
MRFGPASGVTVPSLLLFHRANELAKAGLPGDHSKQAFPRVDETSCCIDAQLLHCLRWRHVTIPVAVSVFPDELYAAPRSWAEQAYPKLIHYNRLPKGGHFAAWEQPRIFPAEIRASFQSIR